MGEWSDLVTYVEDNIGGIKAQALLFSLDCITKKIVERKYKMLKKRLVVATALAAGVAAIPLPGVDVAINTVFWYRKWVTTCASLWSSKKGLML